MRVEQSVTVPGAFSAFCPGAPHCAQPSFLQQSDFEAMRADGKAAGFLTLAPAKFLYIFFEVGNSC